MSPGALLSMKKEVFIIFCKSSSKLSLIHLRSHSTSNVSPSLLILSSFIYGVFIPKKISNPTSIIPFSSSSHPSSYQLPLRLHLPPLLFPPPLLLPFLPLLILPPSPRLPLTSLFLLLLPLILSPLLLL